MIFDPRKLSGSLSVWCTLLYPTSGCYIGRFRAPLIFFAFGLYALSLRSLWFLEVLHRGDIIFRSIEESCARRDLLILKLYETFNFLIIKLKLNKMAPWFLPLCWLNSPNELFKPFSQKIHSPLSLYLHCKLVNQIHNISLLEPLFMLYFAFLDDLIRTRFCGGRGVVAIAFALFFTFIIFISMQSNRGYFWLFLGGMSFIQRRFHSLNLSNLFMRGEVHEFLWRFSFHLTKVTILFKYASKKVDFNTE